ncbi:MAG: polymer-forming cytoskeletal protein [Alphaproteobacteria bacterium]
MFKRKDSGEDGGSKSGREETPSRNAPGGQSAVPQSRVPTAETMDASLAGNYRATPPARPGPEVYRRVIEVPGGPRRDVGPSAPTESKKLIVGRDISLNGKISSCDRLIVEGRVEVELQDCHTIEIAETGTFKGAAEIEGAEVSGHYEGSLTVRNNLLIHSTGHVSGTIRYGRLQIEQGGEINGDVKSLGTKDQ